MNKATAFRQANNT